MSKKNECIDLAKKYSHVYFIPIHKLTIEFSNVFESIRVDVKFKDKYKPTKEEIFQIIEKLLNIETID